METLRNRCGFALIELMVIVAILSLAASFFVPRFLKHRIRKQQEVCSKNLRSLYEAEKSYYGAKGFFATDTATLGWAPQGNRYEYRFLKADKSGFIFECSGNIDKDPTLDQATIDETGQVRQVEDDVIH